MDRVSSYWIVEVEQIRIDGMWELQLKALLLIVQFFVLRIIKQELFKVKLQIINIHTIALKLKQERKLMIDTIGI